MEATTQVKRGARAPDRDTSSLRPRSLDDLSRLDVGELGQVYARGTTPARLGVLEGHPRGRMLSVRALDRGLPARLLRQLAGSSAFPWGGKSFAGNGETGTGLNRVHLAGRHQLFPFLTSVGPSVLDGAPCVVLDYDLPDNPRLIRAIHDEVREIEPGLFLGPAMWKAASGPKLVLWFALDTRVQAPAVGLPTVAATLAK
ncbi:MAG TPA: hypothetical protein VGL81_21160 [Polyangiaceae bacterium]|jgi:hypothetical protein